MKLHERQLEEILIRGNYVSKRLLEEARIRAKEENSSPLDILLAQGTVTPEHLGQAIAKYFGVPYYDLYSHQPSSKIQQTIPTHFAIKYRIIVCSIKENSITITTDHPNHPDLKRELQLLFPKKKIHVMFSLSEDIDSILENMNHEVPEPNVAAPNTNNANITSLFSEQILSKISEIRVEQEGNSYIIRLHNSNDIQSHTNALIESIEEKQESDDYLEAASLYFLMQLKNLYSKKRKEHFVTQSKFALKAWLIGIVTAYMLLFPLHSKSESNTTISQNTVTPTPMVAGANTNPITATTTNTPIPTPTIIEKKLRINKLTTPSLNVRELPELTGKIIGRAKSEQEYLYTELRDNWYYITLENGMQGWISGTYATAIE